MKQELIRRLDGFGNSRKALFTLLAIALLLQILIVAFLPNIADAGDTKQYWSIATNLKHTGHYSFDGVNPTRMRQPLYPLFLAGVRAVFGDSFLPVQIVQIVLNLLTIVVMYLLVMEIWNKRVAFLFLLLMAFYVPLLMTSVTIMTESLFTLLLVASIYFLVLAMKEQHKWLALASGIAVGLGIITRPVVLPLPVVLIAVLCLPFFRLQPLWRKMVLPSTLVAIGCISVLLPWGIRNQQQFGEFTFVSSESGYNLWLNAEAKVQDIAVEDPLRSIDRNEMSRLAAGDHYLERGPNARFNSEALTVIGGDPIGYISKMAKKTVVMGSQLPGTSGLEYHIQTSLTVALGLASRLAQLALLALALFGLAKRASRTTVLMASLIVYFYAVFFVAGVSERQLVPAQPFVLALAAFGIIRLLELWARASRDGPLVSGAS